LSFLVVRRVTFKLEKEIRVSGKILWICIAVILCLSIDTYAIGFMGPPAATHRPLQVSFGLEYSYSEENIMWEDHGATGVEALNNVRRNTLLGKLGVGLLDYWEVSFHVGTATLQANDIDFDGSTDPLRGLGTKVTFYRGERIDLGALFQWSIFEGDETGFIDTAGFNAWEEIDVDEQHFVVGATMRMDGWRLYGGPFYYVFDGDVTIIEIAGAAHKIRPDLEEESEYGGYIGGQFDLGATESLAVEYVYTGEGWGIGVGLSWMF
jgi:hypothetical protein